MTELDHTVLALIARDGPISAYGVRKDFAGSLPQPGVPARARFIPRSAVYRRAGLLHTSAPKGARGKQELRITAAGRVALSQWLSL